MSKRIFTTLMFTFLAFNSFSQFKLGVQASAGINNVKIESLLNKIFLNYWDYDGNWESYSNLPCYKVGINAQYSLSEKYKLNSSVEFMDKRIKMHYYFDTQTDKLDYFYLRNNYNIEKAIGKRFFFSTGFTLNYLILIKTHNPYTVIGDYNTNLKKFNLSLYENLGCHLSKNLKLVLDAEYDLTPFNSITEGNEHYKFRFYNFNLGFRYYFYEKPSKK